MTKDEAFEEFQSHYDIVKNWRADDPWHEAVRDRHDALFNYAFCVNCRDKDPGRGRCHRSRRAWSHDFRHDRS